MGPPFLDIWQFLDSSRAPQPTLKANDDREHTRSFQIYLAYKNIVINFDAFRLTVILGSGISGRVRPVQGKRAQASAVQGARRGHCNAV
jgi:hypothetical protein